MARTFLRSLKFDNETIDAVKILTRYHDYHFDMTAAGLRKAIHKVGEDYFPLLLKIIYADTMAKSDYAKERLLPSYEKVCALYEESLAAQDGFRFPFPFRAKKEALLALLPELHTSLH